MAKAGSPIMTCDKNEHTKKDKHGNYKAVLEEGFTSRETGTRKCTDPDYRPGRTKDNISLDDLTYVEDIEAFLDEQADSYRVVTKSGKERKLRSDAKLCMCGVVKIDSDYIDNLSAADQIRIYRDAYDILKTETPKTFGFEYIAGVIQVDEYSVHLHTVGFDPEFQLSHKADIRYKQWLNFTFPQLLADRGWDIQPNDSHYDFEHAKTLDEEGLEEYKKKCIAEKKNRVKGLDSRQYKAMKKQEEAENNVMSLMETSKALQAENIRLKSQNADLRLENDELNRQNEAVESCLDQKLEQYERISDQAEKAQQLYDQDAERRKQAYKQRSDRQADQIAEALKNRDPLPAKHVPRKLKTVSQRGHEGIVAGHDRQQQADYFPS